MSRKNIHVVPNIGGGWSVKREGAFRASRVFDSQDEAGSYARDFAKKEHVELYIHRRDGTIRTKNSYGSDLFPPRDKR